MKGNVGLLKVISHKCYDIGMKTVQSISYFMMVILIDLGLNVLDYLCLNSLMEMYFSSPLVKVLIYLLLIVIVNPVITYYLCKKVHIKIDGYKKEEIYAVHPEES